MNKKKDLSAEEFAAKLASDADYQAQLTAQQARQTAAREEEQLILNELRPLGYPAASLADLRKSYSPLPADATEVLLEWLGRVKEVAVQDGIVRCLAGAGGSFDIRRLTALFEATSSETLRWAIANTLAELKPFDLREWIIESLARREYGRAREMLPLALARVAPSAVANEVLVPYLDEMPAHVAIGLAESGGLVELELLRGRVSRERGWVKKELQRAIRAIEKRELR